MQVQRPGEENRGTFVIFKCILQLVPEKVFFFTTHLCLAHVVHRRHVERFQQRERLFVGAVDVGGAAEEGLGRESAESGTSIRREEGIMPG